MKKLLLIFVILFWMPIVSNAVTLPWSTTYDCADWDNNDPIDCDGMQNAGGGSCYGNYEQITVAANNPNGDGGKGQRHWYGDGENSGSGGAQVEFSAETELWIRWYMRYPLGFTWSAVYSGYPHYDKLILTFANGEKRQIKLDGGGIGLGGGTLPTPVSAGQGWSVINGGMTGDGQFHYYEVHIIAETGVNNGTFEVWTEAGKILSDTSADFGDTGGVDAIILGSNQEAPDNGGVVAVDYDDIAISATGYIGPLSSAPSLSSSVIAVDGDTLTLTFNENVSQGSGYNNSDWDVDCSTTGNDIAVTYVSGDTTTVHIYTLASEVQHNSIDTCTIDFNGDANSMENDTDDDLAAIVDDSVTNNSEQGDITAPTLSSSTIAASGLSVAALFDEPVSEGGSYSDNHWTLDCTTAGNDIGLTHNGGDGLDEWIFDIASEIQHVSIETCTISFNGTANSVEDSLGNDLGAIEDDSTINNSEQGIPPPYLLLSESFEDQSFSARGWYDNTTHGTIAGNGQSGNCLQWSWLEDATTPTNGGAMRYDIEDVAELFVRFYIKFDTTWRGSQVSYHPHMIYILSNLDDAFSGLADNYLDTYIEFVSDVGSPFEIRPMIINQDSMRVNESLGTPPVDLTETTEERSATYCNGLKSGADTPWLEVCYETGGEWRSSNNYKNEATDVPKNEWVKVETYFKMNTISGSVGQADGIMHQWVNDVQTFNNNAIVYRTNQDATKKWGQFIFAPYIGPGSPIAQIMWIDQLEVYSIQEEQTQKVMRGVKSFGVKQN